MYPVHVDLIVNLVHSVWIARITVWSEHGVASVEGFITSVGEDASALVHAYAPHLYAMNLDKRRKY